MQATKELEGLVLDIFIKSRLLISTDEMNSITDVFQE
jgi:hypothetical protein